VAIGASTPNIDRIAHEALVETHIALFGRPAA
jgi:hypothetical protein